MPPEIIVALITGISSMIVALVSIVLNNRVLGYKFDNLQGDFDELKGKVEKHNQLVERVAVLERDNKTAFKLIDEVRGVKGSFRKEA
jgi:hypothetical protein